MKREDKSRPGVRRRTVLRGLATGFAGALAAPHASSITTAATPSALGQGASADESTSLRVLNEHDHEILVSLCDRLVPGSAAAGVPDLMDRVASVDTLDGQRALLAAIRAFEAEARAVHAARWVDLDEAARIAILDAAASGAREELHRHFTHLRDVAAETYFATEPGMRKLGWTPRSTWRELPRCEHPGDDHR